MLQGYNICICWALLAVHHVGHRISKYSNMAIKWKITDIHISIAQMKKHDYHLITSKLLSVNMHCRCGFGNNFTTAHHGAISGQRCSSCWQELKGCSATHAASGAAAAGRNWRDAVQPMQPAVQQLLAGTEGMQCNPCSKRCSSCWQELKGCSATHAASGAAAAGRNSCQNRKQAHH